ncbi:MAG: deoxyribose-phosphate aldolase [Chloroherpetonaceae bacterium]|nr:deoxyribose-phosphate aldolase [Chloroherpetonaceae bacterium]
MKYTYEELAGMIDHSLLHPALTDQEIEEGCRLAARYRVASVCVRPSDVPRAVELLQGTGVKVGTVVGFPHGSSTTATKRYETEDACRNGATEIDMVIHIGKALSGDWDYVTQDIRAVVEEAHRHGAIVKVIFENDFLPDDAVKIQLCRICDQVNADFVKTSTGYGFVKGADGRYSYQGATEQDLALMRAHCSPRVQVKAAGGVRTLDALIRCRELGATRCGASATAAILNEYHRRVAAQSDVVTAQTLTPGEY